MTQTLLSYTNNGIKIYNDKVVFKSKSSYFNRFIKGWYNISINPREKYGWEFKCDCEKFLTLLCPPPSPANTCPPRMVRGRSQTTLTKCYPVLTTYCHLKWTIVDFLLTTYPPLLVNVVIECPLTKTKDIFFCNLPMLYYSCLMFLLW